MLTPPPPNGTATATPAIGGAAGAAVCCAGLPASGALFGGLPFAAILGLGLGGVFLGPLAWTAIAIFAWTRQCGRCTERNQHQ